MKRHFDFHLKAGRLLPLLLAFFIPFVIMEILVVVQSARVDEKTDTSAAAALLIFLLLLAMFLLSVLLYIPILRRVVSAVSLQGEPFRFQGSAGRFLGLNLLGLLLTGITLGVYGPWYITRVCRYLVGEISFKGQGLRFAGKGGRLLVIMLLTLVVPVILLVLVQAGATKSLFGAQWSSFQAVMLVLLAELIFWSFYAAYLYAFNRWFFTNLAWGERSLSWNTRFGPSVSAIWLQFLLSFVTLGIYLPAAYIKIYRYFIQRTEIRRGGRPEGVLGFEGPTGQGFGLIWGQTLLTLITAGIYSPWLIARCGKWLLSNTCYEENPSP
jgi:uncharacterized membrane protein YjgN (DUF898 family)